MWDVIQVVGALILLVGFLAVQFDRVSERALSYLLVNIVGSGALAVTAVVSGNWGFVLLEGVWTLASMAGLLAWLRRRSPDASSEVPS